MQKKSSLLCFVLYFESNQGRQVKRTALCWPHIIYLDRPILQNAPFRSQIFFASGGKGALTPPNQNPADVPEYITRIMDKHL